MTLFGTYSSKSINKHSVAEIVHLLFKYNYKNIVGRKHSFTSTKPSKQDVWIIEILLLTQIWYFEYTLKLCVSHTISHTITDVSYRINNTHVCYRKLTPILNNLNMFTSRDKNICGIGYCFTIMDNNISYPGKRLS